MRVERLHEHEHVLVGERDAARRQQVGELRLAQVALARLVQFLERTLQLENVLDLAVPIDTCQSATTTQAARATRQRFAPLDAYFVQHLIQMSLNTYE